MQYTPHNYKSGDKLFAADLNQLETAVSVLSASTACKQLLWQNASQGSSFPCQSLSLSLTGSESSIEILFQCSTGIANFPVEYSSMTLLTKIPMTSVNLPVNSGTISAMARVPTNSATDPTKITRSVKYSRSKAELYFSDTAVYDQNGDYLTTFNQQLIPLAVYGIT